MVGLKPDMHPAVNGRPIGLNFFVQLNFDY